ARSRPRERIVDEIRAALWEKVTFINVLDELDLIARTPSGFLCQRPMGQDDGCAGIAGLDDLKQRYDSIDRLERVGEGLYVTPLYVAGSPWGLLRLRVSESNLQHILSQLAWKNQQDLVSAVVIFVVCLIIVSLLLVWMLRSFFRRMHSPLMALVDRALAFAQDPDLPADPIEADPEDEIGLLAGTFVDMQRTLQQTLREKAEADAQLRRSERMASVGVLSATVAHEIGNKLNPMGFAVHNIKRRLEKGKEISPKQIEVLEKGIESAGKILDKLRATARPAVEGRVSLNDVVEEVAMFVGDQLRGNGIMLEAVVGDPEPSVIGYESELVQVVLNLVMNGRDAVLEAERSPGRITVAASTDDQGRAVLRVVDNGVGMTEEVRARIYEPGFTTKGMKTGGGTGGSGLGLHVSYGILERHGVQPEVVSTVGEGTEFVMRFPHKESDEARAT
ncbi:MAG: signal transduction histidine kinase, partial [Myxococcota bacterium]